MFIPSETEEMNNPKPGAGQSKHEAVYDSGPQAKHNPAAGMKAMIPPKNTTPNQGKKSDGRTRYLGK
jgi:hypothetical protein